MRKLNEWVCYRVNLIKWESGLYFSVSNFYGKNGDSQFPIVKKPTCK